MTIAGNFDGHADTAVQCRAHCPMERINGFMQSHWMPPLGKCLHCIAPAAAMFDDFEWNKKKLTKHNFYLAFSQYTDAEKLDNFKTRQGHSTHVLSATTPDRNHNTTIQVEEICYILSYWT